MAKKKAKLPFASFKNDAGRPQGMGRPVARARVPAARSTVPVIEFDPGGLGGQKQELIMVPVPTEQPSSKDNPRGGQGNYTVTFLLQKPGQPLFHERQLDFGTRTGDSHVSLGNTTGEIRIDTTLSDGQGVCVGYANARGALGRLVMRITASGFHDASERAIRIVTPSLSHWSAVLDVPIQIARVELIEESTGTRQMDFVNPFQDTLFRPEGVRATLTHDLRVLLSYYREALNSNSDPYQLLCLFKIIEGVRNRRVRNGRAARKAGISVVVPPLEQVPATSAEFGDWLAPLFPFRTQPWDEFALESIFIPEARGQTIDDLVKGGDRKQRLPPGPLCALRNEVSHSIGQDGGGIPLVADESLHTTRVGNWLPITKCIVRLLLMNEFPDQLWRLTDARQAKRGAVTSEASKPEAVPGSDAQTTSGDAAID